VCARSQLDRAVGGALDDDAVELPGEAEVAPLEGGEDFGFERVAERGWS
jgi:hypothetical protein